MKTLNHYIDAAITEALEKYDGFWAFSNKQFAANRKQKMYHILV